MLTIKYIIRGSYKFQVLLTHSIQAHVVFGGDWNREVLTVQYWGVIHCVCVWVGGGQKEGCL